MRFLPFFSLALILLLSPALTYADSHTNESDTPPAAPASEGLLSIRAIYSDGTAAANSPIKLLARSNSTDVLLTIFTDQSGRLLVPLSAGKYDLDALLDLPATPGVDFASTASAEVPRDSNATLIFYPSGSLSGTVQQDGSPVPNARVRVSCPSPSFDYERINGVLQKQSGEAGDFLFRVLPTGTCVVSASTDSFAGSFDAPIQHGKITSAPISTKRKSGGIDALAIAAALIALAALLFLLNQRFFGAKEGSRAEKIGAQTAEKNAHLVHAQSSHAHPHPHGASKPAEEKEKSKFDATTPRAKAILSTLRDREGEIVKFLFKNNGRAKRSQMQHKLLIPKTSLLRNLRSLERKNIIKLTPFGRNLLAEIEEKIFT